MGTKWLKNGEKHYIFHYLGIPSLVGTVPLRVRIFVPTETQTGCTYLFRTLIAWSKRHVGSVTPGFSRYTDTCTYFPLNVGGTKMHMFH